MTDFTPLQSAMGGALIGLSAVLLMAALGRVAGGCVGDQLARQARRSNPA